MLSQGYALGGVTREPVGYDFPKGSTLAPRSYLVLAKDRSVFSVRYGGAIPVFGEFSGEFQRDGETVSLLDTNGAIIKRVPAVFFAGMVGFGEKPYFTAKPGTDTPPAVSFDFNKKP